MNPEELFTDAQLELARAIDRADLAAVRALAPGVDLNALGDDGATLLFFALQRARGAEPARLAVVTELVRLGADAVSYRHENLGSVMEAALRSANPAFVAAILDGGVSPDVRLMGGARPAIFWAANEHCAKVLELLVARGADVNARDTLHNTALTDALTCLQLDQVEYLVRHGADVRTHNRLGVSFAHTLSYLLGGAPPATPTGRRLAALRDRLIDQGVAWPPTAPAAVRDEMRARGEDPIVPAGARA